MPDSYLDDLGTPELAVGPLRVWVHGRQFPDDPTEWDGNWLRITAHCARSGASVRVHGALLMSQGIARWLEELRNMDRTLQGSARLCSHEPNLSLTVGPVDRTGHLEIKVEITPDHINQRHEFLGQTDQTRLPAYIAEAKRLLERYPVRGTTPESPLRRLWRGFR